ncbi:MBL fold metallo-hydrolase [Bythopirellula polymerisocia]|uniref:Ribonuclease n=1 Tax=Bythopirellula polymerisocia TaxID=2528003 RepID=A0A5C6D2C8_9BACT|nr:MBL fold metallo-hydrolase [Bythopirellula polymerisocia]TWU29366.1 Ribonuclease [Bythopirellula polymerisocia]
MFHWDQGLFLTKAGLALDVTRRQKVGFISHAHADHMARHELAICTPETARLYQHRLGAHRRTKELRYREPMRFGPLTLTLYPAGHCLGSAMLLADDGEKRLLFTGDFKLGSSATCEEAELPKADILVMESTFGKPKYRLPPRDQTVTELVALVREILESGMTPVIHAYALGKAQEVTKLLTLNGIKVQQHPTTFAVSQVYRQCGIDLGDVTEYKGRVRANHAVVTLPRGMKNFRIAGIKHPVSIAVTGWAVDSGAKYRYRVDHALPLSDHADFEQLLETARCVGAAEIYCTHGSAEFVGHLSAAGFNALPVTGSYQMRMF